MKYEIQSSNQGNSPTGCQRRSFFGVLQAKKTDASVNSKCKRVQKANLPSALRFAFKFWSSELKWNSLTTPPNQFNSEHIELVN